MLLFTISLFLPFYFSLAAVICIAFLTLVRGRLREKAFSAPYTKIVFCFLTVAFFTSAIYNNYIGIAYSLLSYAIVICGLYLRSVMTQSLYRRAMDTACAASIWCAAAAIIQKALIYGADPAYRPASFFDNANYYGMMIEFVVAIALYRIFTNPERTPFYVLVIGANLIGLYLSASCSSFIAMLAAAAVILISRKDLKASAVFFTIMAAGFLAVLLFPSLVPRTSMEFETSLSERLSIWAASWRAFKRSAFFGRGPEAYRLIWEQYGGSETFHCHNLLLDMLLNYGILGSALACAYVVLQGKLLAMRYRFGFCRNMDILLAALAAAVLVHGLTDVTILWIQTIGLLFLVASSMGIGAGYVAPEMFMPELLPKEQDSSARLSF